MVGKVEVGRVEGRDPQERILGEPLKLMLRYYEPLSSFHASREQRAEMGEKRLRFSWRRRK